MSLLLSGTEKRRNIAILIGIVVTATSLIYVTVKPYPMDYEDGALLVDPAVMMVDCYGAAGDFLGFLIGIYVEKTFVHFDTEGTRLEKVIRFIIGAIPFAILYFVATPALCSAVGSRTGTVIGRFVTFLYVLAVWPWIFKEFHEHMNRSNRDNSSVLRRSSS